MRVITFTSDTMNSPPGQSYIRLSGPIIDQDMLQRLPFIHRRIHRAMFIVAALAVIPALLACSSSSGSSSESGDPSDGLSLVWEAWEQINETYASSGVLDTGPAVSGAMRRVLDQVDVAPYPFLTDIGRMRGQPPSHVPGELADLWRAVATGHASGQYQSEK